MKKFGIVADDLTGATTVGVLLAKAGVRTAAFFNEKDLAYSSDQDAVVLSTDSRALPKKDAADRVKQAVQNLKNKGITNYSKRIDTTLRGNIGTEVDSMLQELGSDTIAVMVPSMPQSNRILVGGYSIIDGVPLSLTPVANDVRTPVEETHCPTLMRKQTNRKIGVISLNVLLSGKEAVKKALELEKEQGAEIIIADAVSMDDVSLLAESVCSLQWNVLAIDPGPFTTKLAEHSGCAIDHDEQAGDGAEGIFDGKVLAVAGSATPVTKMQMEELLENDWAESVAVSAEMLIDRSNSADQEIQVAIGKALEKLKSDKVHVVVLETSLTGKRINLKDQEKALNLKQGEAADNINGGLGEIAKGILALTSNDVKGIYMTGGDTMVHTLKRLEARGIQLLDYVIPQADLGTILGGENEGLVVVGKGGLTGEQKTATQIVKRIFTESTRLEKVKIK
ncbi:four-carbon acid sugar kinase family protein [Gracilibacillus sp. YIM 98692]|uniref:four-carbon acid sugar kinase family protein n=1 Tax=Gracilibacillus sp. YIM 98692 TaxID=2663532 RepID=UPI0013D59259|nr:four-carbon acid sugar kinase family protein [Gracilibacillus sp. YIM 98692]